MSRLVVANVQVTIDVKESSSAPWVREALEAALNTACTMLEDSPVRDPEGSVMYRIENKDGEL